MFQCRFDNFVLSENLQQYTKNKRIDQKVAKVAVGAAIERKYRRRLDIHVFWGLNG